MKKTYITPRIIMLQLHHQGLLMQSIARTQSNADLNYQGAGNGDSRTKEQGNVWDEEW